MKLLIIRLSSMGDIILTLPVVRQIRASYPEAEIHFLVKKEFEELLQGEPIDKVYPITVSSGLGELRKKIPREKYTHVLDLHNNLRSRIISWGLNARIGQVNK